jgi:hypothetical protein
MRAGKSRDTTLSQPYCHWMAVELVSCNAILPNPVGDVYVDVYISVCMGGSLTHGLAAKHKLQKRQHKKRDNTVGPPTAVYVADRQANCIHIYIFSMLRQC